MRADQRSEESKSWRHLYNRQAWKGPKGRRARQLAQEPLCRLCARNGRITPATVADHIEPHKGDETLFWKGRLQSLCAPHHDAAKQSIDRQGFGGECDETGWPTDHRHPANLIGS